MQNELATIVNEGSAAWGKVKITINGNRDLIGVSIDETMLSNKTKLEEAIKDAFKDAAGMKFQMKLAKKMQDMGGMDLLKQFGGGE